MSLKAVISKTLRQFLRKENNKNMGIFDNIFGSKNEEGAAEKKQIPWIPLASVAQLEDITKKSASTPQVIFKHSTTCGISRMVLNMFTSAYDLEERQMEFYFLDLHAHRDVSNAVAETYQVRHQSPQLLVIKNGVVVAHDSHGAINEIPLGSYI